MTAPRVEYGLASELYRDAPGLAHSDAKRLRKSPWHYKAMTLEREVVPRSVSPQMALGTMVHVAVLEPGDWDQRYRLGPDINKNTNAWREFAQRCQDDGVEPVTQPQLDQVQAMAASVRSLPDFAPIIDACATEVSMWWHCAKTGVLCKARPDVVKRYPPGLPIIGDEKSGLTQEVAERAQRDGFAILADVKTTEDASAEGFTRSVADYSYHTQAHWYMEAAEATLGVPVLSFLFAVVERDYPYAAASYTLDANALTVAGEINLAARETYVACKKADAWPGYAPETRDISLPHWYMKRYLQGLPV